MMESEEIARLVEELDLEKEAKQAVVTINAKSDERIRSTNTTRMVVGKVFASRIVNRATLRIHIPRILQLRGEADIEIVGDNLFVIIFANQRDRSHALNEGPWHFFNSLLLFKEPHGLETAREVNFTEFTTWIQCHNIPLACMHPSIVRKIGEAVGRVEEIDTGEGGNCIGQYARVRVTRDVDKPLRRCVQIRTEDTNESQTILIRYEKLPEYCMACGRVGHNVRVCEDGDVDKTKRTFGPWLKASPTMELRRGRRDISPQKQREGSHVSGNPGTDSNSPKENLEASNDMEISSPNPSTQAENGSRGSSDSQQRQEERTRGVLSKKGELGVRGMSKEGEDKARANTQSEEGEGNHATICEKPKEKKKAWKRLARTPQREETAISRDQERRMKQAVGRKREAEWAIDGREKQKLKHGVQDDLDMTNTVAAEVAEQPRRSQ